MKTTLVIDDKIIKELKEEAAKRNTTISELVESALRLMLNSKNKKKKEVLPTPTFDLGGAYVDISNRDELYGIMENN